MSMPVHPLHQCECSVCQQQTDEDIMRYHHQVNLLLSRLAEPQRRWCVGVLSQEPASPGDAQLALITGLDEKTIRRGRQEMAGELLNVPLERQRQVGGGRLLSEKKTRA
jgi:hypothetical protein